MLRKKKTYIKTQFSKSVVSGLQELWHLGQNMTKFKALIDETVSWPHMEVENPKAMDPQPHRKNAARSNATRRSTFQPLTRWESRHRTMLPCLARLSTISKDHYDSLLCFVVSFSWFPLRLNRRFPRKRWFFDASKWRLNMAEPP